jgi:hypothetical protein
VSEPEPQPGQGADRATLRRQRILFAVGTLALLGLLWQPHVFLNDELVQGLGLDALSHGRLELQKPFPPDFVFLQSEGWHHLLIPKNGTVLPPAGSTPLNLVALPLYEALRIPAFVLGAPATLTLVVATLASTALRLVLRARPPRRWPSATWAAPLGLFALILASIFTPIQRNSPAGTFALELGSIQLVSMACAALGGILVHDALRERFPKQAWTLACAYTFATPAAFWGGQAKYHSAAILLVVAVAWALLRVAERRRFLVAGLFAGLAIWNQLPLGGVAALALGATALAAPAPLLARLRRAGQAIAGGLVGIVGLAVEWAILRAHAFSSQFVDASDPGGSVAGGLLACLRVDWPKVVHVFREALVWTDGKDLSGAQSFACLAPFLVLGLAALARRFRPALSSAFALFGVGYIALLFVLLAGQLQETGFSYENRHVVTVLPLLVLLGAPALAEAAEAAGQRGWAWIGYGAAFLFVLNPLLNFGGHQFAYAFTHENRLYDAVWLWRTLGSVAAAAAAGWAAWSGFRPSTRNSREVAGALWVIGLSLAVSVQVWLLLSRDGYYNPRDEPFRFWLVEGLHNVVDKITFFVSSRHA